MSGHRRRTTFVTLWPDELGSVLVRKGWGGTKGESAGAAKGVG